MGRSVGTVGCLFALVLAGPQAHANTIIDVQTAGIDPSASLSSISIDYTGPGGPVTFDNVYAGVIDLNLTPSSPYDAGGTLGVFCTDIFTELHLVGGYFVAESALENGEGVTLSTPIKDDIGWLINNYSHPDANTVLLGMTQDEFAAATQLAIWQTEYTSADFSFLSYGAGAGGLNDTVLPGPVVLPGYVTDLEDDIGTFAGTVDEWEPSDPSGNPNPQLNQGQSFVNSGGITDFEPIPEPASMALVSVGLIGLAAVRRRKRG